MKSIITAGYPSLRVSVWGIKSMDEIIKINHLLLIAFFAAFTSACSESSADKMVAGEFADDANQDEDIRMPMGFFRTCAASNCSDFDVVEGEKTEKDAASWHPREKGIRLVGDPVIVSSSDEYAAHPEALWHCYDIFVLGGWDDSVEMKVRVEGEYGIFGISHNEDSDDLEESPAAGETFTLVRKIRDNSWTPWRLSVRTLKERGKITFSLEKEGEGDARFYYIEISGGEDCTESAVELD